MITFRIFLTINLLIAAIAVFFFVWGLSDGTVSSFNAGLWAGLLAVVIGVPTGGYLLHRNGQRAAALVLLGLLAVPGLLAALFFLILMIAQPRWN